MRRLKHKRAIVTGGAVRPMSKNDDIAWGVVHVAFDPSQFVTRTECVIDDGDTAR